MDTLNSEGPFTVFAPNDDKWARISESTPEVKRTVLRHIVEKKSLDSAIIPVGLTVLKTAGGEDITITKTDRVRISSSEGTATVIEADIQASNGVIHVVDAIF